MVLKLYGYPYSTSTRRVALTLYEKQVPFEFITVDLVKGEHKSDEFSKIQPFNKVPYINDDGYIMYESRAITRYIAAKYANQGIPLVPSPTSPAAYGHFEQAAYAETCNYDPPVSVLLMETFGKPQMGLEPDQALVAQQMPGFRRVLDVFETTLSQQAYLSGPEFGLVDIWVVPSFAIVGVSELSTRPHLARWWKDVTSRKSWQVLGEVNTSVEKY